MLTKKQIGEIREHLEKAQNPIFYYDNDADGLCAFLLLRRYCGKGSGVAIRSYPALNASYADKARQLKADYVFVLDKPVVAKEFFEEIDKMQLPLVWIDHHLIPQAEEIISGIFFYNPSLNKGKDKSSEPTSYLAYKISERKEDLWLAVAGCIADCYMPDFAGEFAKMHPDFWGDAKLPFDAYYKTEIGRIALALNFGLKDSASHIVELQKFMISCKSPNEIFLELDSNKNFRSNLSRIRKKYEAILEDAKKNVFGRIIFYAYSGELSISADISNELSYYNPDKYIVIAYMKGSITNISMRGKRVRGILERILKQLSDSTGGGHEDAVGARIRTEDLKKFKSLLEEETAR